MAAVISNRVGSTPPSPYVSEAKRMGVAINSPDVRKSRWPWTGKDRGIRVGLSAVSELSEGTAARIVQMRAHRQYADFPDFMARVRPAAHEVRSLVHAGALDGINPGGTRASLLWEISCREQKGRGAVPSKLFDPSPAPMPVFPVEGRIKSLRNEYLALGFLCDTHPVCLIKKDGFGRIVQAAALERYVGQTVRFVGWLLTGKLVSTRTGEVMEFLTFEDHTGLLETTFSPAVYRRYAHLLVSAGRTCWKGLSSPIMGGDHDC